MVRWLMYELEMIWEERSWRNTGTTPPFSWRTEENHKDLSITRVLAETRVEHLPTTNLGCYRYVSLLDLDECRNIFAKQADIAKIMSETKTFYFVFAFSMGTRELICWHRKAQSPWVKLSLIKPLKNQAPPQTLTEEPLFLKHFHHTQHSVLRAKWTPSTINLMCYVLNILTNPQEGVNMFLCSRRHIQFKVGFSVQIKRTRDCCLLECDFICFGETRCLHFQCTWLYFLP
jgi:hypothetical protein